MRLKSDLLYLSDDGKGYLKLGKLVSLFVSHRSYRRSSPQWHQIRHDKSYDSPKLKNQTTRSSHRKLARPHRCGYPGNPEDLSVSVPSELNQKIRSSIRVKAPRHRN